MSEPDICPSCGATKDANKCWNCQHEPKVNMTTPTSTITAFCNRAEAIASKATPGPWSAITDRPGWTTGIFGWRGGGCVASVVNAMASPMLNDDATAIAHARTALPRATAALRVAVEEINKWRNEYPHGVRDALARIAAELEEES